MNFYAQIKRMRSSDMDKTTQALFQRSLKYIGSGTYSTHPRANEIMSQSVSGLSDQTIADGIGLTHTAVRITRQRCYREVTELLGEDYFDLIERGNKASLKKAFARLKTAESFSLSSLEDQIDPYFIARMKFYAKDPGSGYDARDCKHELGLLLKHKKSDIEDQLSQCDPRGLGYALKLLTGQGGLPEDRVGLSKTLTSKKEK